MGLLRRLIRWSLRGALLVLGPLAIITAGSYFYMKSGRYVTTENAYVKSDLIIVTAEVSGVVTQVAVGDNAQVEEGALLFRIDPRRFIVERDRRQAELEAALQGVDALKARYRSRLAQLTSAKWDADFVAKELARFEQLHSGGTISESRIIEIRREAAATSTRLDVIREDIAEVLAALSGNPDIDPQDHPDVLRAQAELARAELDLQATAVYAPSRAISANLTLQAGEYVEEGDAVMSLVTAEAFWVEANLKETDLTHLQIGQAVELRVDAYPDIAWTGVVESLSPATGAEYAILPPQNASGNWVKVVQRVPVRLAIDPLDGAPPLRAGMSVAVSIDTEFERPLPDVLNQARAWILPEDPR
ncbi:MAG: HlyD family secretion protein [Pseudomonadota bacterium]